MEDLNANEQKDLMIHRENDKEVLKEYQDEFGRFERDRTDTSGKVRQAAQEQRHHFRTVSCVYPRAEWTHGKGWRGTHSTGKSSSNGTNLPSTLWPEVFKTAGYLNNRTPKNGLGWKTPCEALTGETPELSHLHPYGCRAYPLRHDVPRSQKLEARALIEYLVGYDSSNIFRVWIPSRMRVIRTRDVRFDHSRFYDPAELDAGHLKAVSIEDLVEVLDIPEPSWSNSPSFEEEDDSSSALRDALQAEESTNWTLHSILHVKPSVDSYEPGCF